MGRQSPCSMSRPTLGTGTKALCQCMVLLSYSSLVLSSRQDAFIGYSEHSSSVVVFRSNYGDIHVALLETVAPKTCQLVKSLAQGGCNSCHFYRNEMPPKTGYGPPYGLLQGSLEGLSIVPPREETIVAKRGHACVIPGSKEFFIAAADHDEWGSAHTVFGMVNNLTTVELLLQQAFHTFTHPTYGTVMRMLDQKESFTVHALM